MRSLQTTDTMNGENEQELHPGENQGSENVGHSETANCCASYSPTQHCRCRDPMKSIDLFKDRWEQTTNCRNKLEAYNRIMELSPHGGEEDNAGYFDPVWRSFIRSSNTKQLERHKQHASAVVVMRDKNKMIFPAVYPDFQNKKEDPGAPHIQQNQSAVTDKTATHSEEKLIKQLDDFLRRDGRMVQRIMIYTYNSPCLKREKKTEPCMFQLLRKAYEWYENYEVLTDVAFTKFWGLSGPNYLKNLTFSTISCPRSDFHSRIEKCQDIPFKLDHNYLGDLFRKSDIYNTLSQVKGRDRNTLREDMKSARKALLRLAESSFGLRKDHLDRGKQKIDSFKFLPEVHDTICEKLQKEWKEMVDNSSMTPIREDITEEFNSAVVHVFRERLKSFLGKNSPLRLYRVPQMSCENLMICDDVKLEKSI